MNKDTKRYQQTKPRKHATQERSKLTVESILEAAIQVFEQHGYAAGTTARIAERAGVSIGSLYQYFPNKDAILVALAKQHLIECQTVADHVLASGTAQPFESVLRALTEGFIQLHLRNPVLHRLLFEEVVLPAEIRELFDDMEHKLIGDLAIVIEGHTGAQTVDSRRIAYFTIQVIEHLTHAVVLHPEHGYSYQACQDEIVRVVLGYLRHSDL